MMKELVGKTIQAIWIDGDEQGYLSFDTNDGQFRYVAQGDCCSESWFYHILGADALLGHTVTSVVEVDMPDPTDGFSRQEVDQLYGINIRTDVGMADVEFRNSSNGYYGGWVEFMEDTPIPDSVRMVQVTEDYTAQLS
jgi:hypothetical protein